MNVARIRMPRMGSGVHEGTVVEWKKSVGDAVSKGEVLLAAESEKVDFEIESPADGVIEQVDAPRELVIHRHAEVHAGRPRALIPGDELCLVLHLEGQVVDPGLATPGLRVGPRLIGPQDPVIQEPLLPDLDHADVVVRVPVAQNPAWIAGSRNTSWSPTTWL